MYLNYCKLILKLLQNKVVENKVIEYKVLENKVAENKIVAKQNFDKAKLLLNKEIYQQTKT